MSHGVSIAHAKRLARKTSDAQVHTARIDEEGKLQSTIVLDVRETHLKQGKTQDVRVVLYESDSVGEGKQPKPLPTATGKKALTIPMSVRPKDGVSVGLTTGRMPSACASMPASQTMRESGSTSWSSACCPT